MNTSNILDSITIKVVVDKQAVVYKIPENKAIKGSNVEALRQRIDVDSTIIVTSKNCEDPSKSLGLRLYFGDVIIHASITLQDALKHNEMVGNDKKTATKFVSDIQKWIKHVSGIQTVVLLNKNLNGLYMTFYQGTWNGR